MIEPEDPVLDLLRKVRGEMATAKDIAKLIIEISELRSEVKSLRADVDSGLMALGKWIEEQLSQMNQSVTAYHSSVVGQGVLVNEFARLLRRVEEHL